MKPIRLIRHAQSIANAGYMVSDYLLSNIGVSQTVNLAAAPSQERTKIR